MVIYVILRKNNIIEIKGTYPENTKALGNEPVIIFTIPEYSINDLALKAMPENMSFLDIVKQGSSGSINSAYTIINHGYSCIASWCLIFTRDSTRRLFKIQGFIQSFDSKIRIKP